MYRVSEPFTYRRLNQKILRCNTIVTICRLGSAAITDRVEIAKQHLLNIKMTERHPNSTGLIARSELNKLFITLGPVGYEKFRRGHLMRLSIVALRRPCSRSSVLMSTSRSEIAASFSSNLVTRVLSSIACTCQVSSLLMRSFRASTRLVMIPQETPTAIAAATAFANQLGYGDC